MAQGQGHSVRRVVRLGRILKAADAPDHIHDLGLLRPAIAHHRLFDLQRRVLVHLEPGLAAGQQYNSPAVGNGNAGSQVGVKKQLFNGGRIRPEKLYEPEHIVVYLLQPAGQAGVSGSGDDPAVYEFMAVFIGIQQAKAYSGYPRVDTQHSHLITSRRNFNTFSSSYQH